VKPCYIYRAATFSPQLQRATNKISSRINRASAEELLGGSAINLAVLDPYIPVGGIPR